MRKIVLLMCFLLFGSLFVSETFATLPQQPIYPLYVGVNETAKIIAGSQEIGVYNVSITFKGQTEYLDYYPDIDRYKIYLLSDIEEDVYFTLRGYDNESPFIDIFNFDVLNDDKTITDNLIHAFKYNHTAKHNESLSESVVICVDVKTKQGIPDIYFVSGYENGSQIVWNRNDLVHSITDNSYQTYCHQHTVNFASNFQNDYFYYGFYCDNCGLTTKLDLNVENDDLLNNSVYFDDLNDNTSIVENTMNFGISTSISDVDPLYYYEDYIKFRIPYNITIRLFKENSSTYIPGVTTPYCNQFSNIYMLRYQEDEEINNYDEVLNALNKVFFLFDPLNIQELYGVELDENSDLIFFNGAYSDCSATITLYELGNYSVYLVGSKQVIQDKDYAFTDLVTGDEQFVSKITKDQALIFTEKANYDVDIFTTDWEISKIWVLLNIGKWLLITVLPLVLIFLIKSGVLSAWIVKRI